MPAPHLVNGLRHLIKDVSTTPATIQSGLQGVVCGDTELIGFHNGQVEYCGVDVRQLCGEGSFEAVMWLLMKRCRPNPEELSDASCVLAELAVVDQPVADMIGTVPLQTRTLDLFPLCIQLLSCFDPTPGDRTLDASHSQFWRVMAQLPVLLHVAFGGRLDDGRALLSDETESISFAGRLLQILRDDNSSPTAEEEHAMNAVLICECMTEMRAACFSARFFGSAVNDVVAGLKAASSMFVSQLRNDPFSWTAERFNEFGSAEEAEKWFYARETQTMPFGFTDQPEDDRSKILRQQCRGLLGSVESMILESTSTRLEELLQRDDKHPTVDWTAARTLMLLNVPEDRISIAIGIARMVGWAAQTMEQHNSGVGLLPTLRYAGATAETA